MIESLKQKSFFVREETLKLHGAAPESRIASALSAVEIFVVLYYGNILNFEPHNPQWEGRDRFIVSKGHGGISLYPVLADSGFFDMQELRDIGKTNAILKAIPDCCVPGFEAINGSLGHGLGEACGMAVALKRKGSLSKVFVLCGDWEMNEGSVWESIMFASHHKLDNLILIIDSNKLMMLGYCRDILDMEPFQTKLEAFNWKVDMADGHDVEQLHRALKQLKEDDAPCPKALVANTIKGKGVPSLETDPLCHVRSLKKDEIEEIIGRLRCQMKK